MEKDDLSYLEEDAGAGFEGMNKNVFAIPFLQLTQSSSEIVQAGEREAGHFLNSLSKEDYGTSLKVVVCKFAIFWVERDSGGKSVARYDVGSIRVVGDNFKGMKNPETGNSVVETWYYQVFLPEHPEAGYMIFSSSPGNMRYLKAFNTQMHFLRLPSGASAPIYAGIWEWTIGPDVSKAGKKFHSFKGGVKLTGFLPKFLYEEAVLPIKEATFLLPPPATDIDPDATENEKNY